MNYYIPIIHSDHISLNKTNVERVSSLSQLSSSVMTWNINDITTASPIISEYAKKNNLRLAKSDISNRDIETILSDIEYSEIHYFRHMEKKPVSLYSFKKYRILVLGSDFSLYKKFTVLLETESETEFSSVLRDLIDKQKLRWTV